MPKNSPTGDLAAKRVADSHKLRGFKNQGKGDSGANYFATKVAQPGTMGEKAHKA